MQLFLVGSLGVPSGDSMSVVVRIYLGCLRMAQSSGVCSNPWIGDCCHMWFGFSGLG
jgi:hypothetical protein